MKTNLAILTVEWHIYNEKNIKSTCKTKVWISHCIKLNSQFFLFSNNKNIFPVTQVLGLNFIFVFPALFALVDVETLCLVFATLLIWRETSRVNFIKMLSYGFYAHKCSVALLLFYQQNLAQFVYSIRIYDQILCCVPYVMSY